MMIKLTMSQSIFYNNRSKKTYSKESKILQVKTLNPKRNVDINLLLNKVKINKKEEAKKKIIFSIYGFLILSSMVIFILAIK